ncbi:hypothetical protein PABG_02951 [Paracoccidioides brasiliensis Pb03]|nr:hypothetical protein PABG_02951 [Paracoccidioides brasiliensis Pb03]
MTVFRCRSVIARVNPHGHGPSLHAPPQHFESQHLLFHPNSPAHPTGASQNWLSEGSKMFLTPGSLLAAPWAILTMDSRYESGPNGKPSEDEDEDKNERDDSDDDIFDDNEGQLSPEHYLVQAESLDVSQL